MSGRRTRDEKSAHLCNSAHLTDAYRQGVIDGKTEGFDVGYQQGYDHGYQQGDTDNAVISAKHEATELLIADIVQKAHPYGVQDGDFIASYLLATGPIHRAIKYLNEHGISTIAEPNQVGEPER